MSKKIALVSGANKGIGLETVRQLAQKGIQVLLGARDSVKGEKAASVLKAESLDVEFVSLDVSNQDSINSCRDFIASKYGVIDILVNNAGVMSADYNQSLEQININVIRETFETNFFGLIALTQAMLPFIKKSSSGRIVNLSSILGSLSRMSETYDWKALSYNSSKTAVNAFTVFLAEELKNTKIKVNSAHPGWVKTDMGGEIAPMNIVDGAKTSVWLATLGEDGPTGGYFHMQDPLGW